jgi:hypothetical protein
MVEIDGAVLSNELLDAVHGWFGHDFLWLSSCGLVCSRGIDPIRR